VNYIGNGSDVTVPVNVATIVQLSCYLTCTLRDKCELLPDNKNKNTVGCISIPFTIPIPLHLLDFLPKYEPYFQI